MGATVGVGDRWVWMTNGSWEQVVESVLAVARARATTDLHRASIARLEAEQKTFYPGYDPNFEQLFPTPEERAFWAMCFRDAGRQLCLGELPSGLWAGSPAKMVFYAYWCAEVLSGLLRGATIDFDETKYVDEDTRLRDQARNAQVDG